MKHLGHCDIILGHCDIIWVIVKYLGHCNIILGHRDITEVTVSLPVLHVSHRPQSHDFHSGLQDEHRCEEVVENLQCKLQLLRHKMVTAFKLLFMYSFYKFH